MRPQQKYNWKGVRVRYPLNFAKHILCEVDKIMKLEDLGTLPRLAQDYLHSLERRLHAERTILEYASDLRLFFRFVAEQRGLLPSDAPWDEIDLASLIDTDFVRTIRTAETDDFIHYCRNIRKNDANTLSRRFIAIKRFFHYLATHHILDVNPMDILDSQRTKKSLPVYLPLDDCLLLLDTVEQDGANPFRERDYCMLVLFLNCGMRLSELCGLNLADILWQDETMRIRGKGSKERTVYLNDACLAALRRYLKTRPQEGLKHEDRDAVFISRNKRRINQRSVELMLEKYLGLCGLDGKGYSVHKLRHTAATLMYQNDVDVLQLKEILGHENLSTTQIYTHVLDAQLRAAVEANPLSAVRAEEE